MRVVSVNVGLPREVAWRGKKVLTSIYKHPVEKRLRARTLNLDGDEQADLTVHGGVDKAIYLYPAEHYAFWRGELPDADLPWGAFGENLTITGLLERDVQIGDRFRIGTTELAVTQPRMPCFKLGIRFERPDMVKRFLVSRRSGFYCAVLREGDIGAGDAIAPLEKAEDSLSIPDIVGLYAGGAIDREKLRRAANLAGLPEGWRDYFRDQLANLRA